MDFLILAHSVSPERIPKTAPTAFSSSSISHLERREKKGNSLSAKLLLLHLWMLLGWLWPSNLIT